MFSLFGDGDPDGWKEREAEREDEALAGEEGREPDPGPSEPPSVLVATEPTELIVTDGLPEWGPIEGNELLYMTNTESDILMEVGAQRYFVLYRRTGLVSP